MKKLIAILFVLVWSCAEKKVENDFDEIVHYYITDEVAKVHYPNKQFMDVYWNYDSPKINFITFEKELLEFGYVKRNLNKLKTTTVNDFITNELYYGPHMVACEPIYRDILILKKKNKVKAIIKLCFECSMIDSYGKINSNKKEVDVEKDLDIYMNNFQKLKTILYNSDSSANK